MSTILVIKYQTPSYDFDNINHLANTIIHHALKNNYAVSFNDEYANEFLQGNVINSIIVSDSFLYRQADELLDVTEYSYSEDSVFNSFFIHKYSFLQFIAETLLNNGAKNITIYISDGGNCNSSDSIHIESNTNNLMKKLYKAFIDNICSTGFSFPDICINITH